MTSPSEEHHQDPPDKKKEKNYKAKEKRLGALGFKKVLTEINLGRSLYAPRQRGEKDLALIASLFSRAQCYIITQWALAIWNQHPHLIPDYESSSKKELYKAAAPPNPNNIFKKLYNELKDVFPKLSGTLRSAASKRIYDTLGSKFKSSNPMHKAQRVWQAILWYERFPHGYAPSIIPFKSSDTTVICGKGPGTDSEVHCTLFSNISGRKHRRLRFQLLTKRLSPGRRARVQSVDQELEKLRDKNSKLLSDSMLCWKRFPTKKRYWKQHTKKSNKERQQLAERNGQAEKEKKTSRKRKHRDGRWVLQLLAYELCRNHDLDPTRIAILRLNPSDSECPFTIIDPDGKQMQLIDAGSLLAHLDHKETKAITMTYNYRQSRGQVKGRGRKKYDHCKKRFEFYKRVRSRGFIQNIMNRATRFCIKHNCGGLYYEEPSLYRRKKTWFTENNINMDWTNFRDGLKSRLGADSIPLETSTEARKKAAKEKRQKSVRKSQK